MRAYRKMVSSYWFGHEENIELLITVIRLKTLPTTISQEETVKILFEGIDPKDVDFSFLFDFSAELLVHLGIACTCYDNYSAVRDSLGLVQYLDDDEDEDETASYWPTEFISKNADELLKEAQEKRSWNRKQEILKALVCRSSILIYYEVFEGPNSCTYSSRDSNAMASSAH